MDVHHSIVHACSICAICIRNSTQQVLCVLVCSYVCRRTPFVSLTSGFNFFFFFQYLQDLEGKMDAIDNENTRLREENSLLRKRVEDLISEVRCYLVVFIIATVIFSIQ